MKVEDKDLGILKTNVRGKVFEVTPDLIAVLMKYQRPPPNTLVYPHNIQGRKSLPEYVQLTYEEPT